MAKLRTIWPYTRGYRTQLTLGPLFKMVEAAIELATPMIMAQIVDDGIRAGDRELIQRTGLRLLLLVTLGMGTSLVAQYMASVASQGIGTRLRSEVFRQVNRLPVGTIYETGEDSLLNRLTADVNQIQVGIAMFIRLLSRAPFLAVGGVIMSFRIHARLAVILLLAVPAATILLYYIMKAVIRLVKGVNLRLDKITELTQDNLAGVRVIRAFAREGHERRFFAGKNDDLAKQEAKAGRMSALMNPLTSLLFNSAVVLVVWQGAAAVNVGTLTQGEMLAIVNYLSLIVTAMMVVANLVMLFPRAYASGIRVAEVLEEGHVDIDDAIAPGHISIDSEGGETPVLALRDLTFTYPGNQLPSLLDISFDLYRGETLGVIGSTGSSKSTLLELLMGFYQPDSGQIDYQGKPLGDWTLRDLRESQSWVPQKAVLVSGTVRENLLWGGATEELREDLTDDKLWAALEAAQAHDFIRNMEGGLDAVVESEGLNFSGGQRQRLTIARALLRKVDLWLLDDISSALDYRTDARMRKAMEPYLADSAVIRVSQRVYQIKNADHIMVLDNGRMSAYGTHQELLRTSELYREIVASQSEE